MEKPQHNNVMSSLQRFDDFMRADVMDVPVEDFPRDFLHGLFDDE